MRLQQRRPEYIKELRENHQISGEARIGAEWNWNNTSLLLDPARPGSKIRVYDASGVSTTTPTGFQSVFTEDRYRKTLNHYTVNWTNEVNTPHIDWATDGAWDWIPVHSVLFGAEQIFYIDVDEVGQWKFGVDSDDSHELWIYDENEENPVKLTSHYGGRKMSGKFTETATHTFSSKGRYMVRALLTNIDLWWGINIGVQTPEMISEGQTMKEIPAEMTLNPDDLNHPMTNPEIVNFTPNEKTEAWDEWRDYFPVSSIVEPYRPHSGIHYNELNDRAKIMSNDDFMHTSGIKGDRYYLLGKKSELQYRYWMTDEESDAQGNLKNSTVRISYEKPVQTNKIVLKFNLGPIPTSLTIRYSVKDQDGDHQWTTILDENDPVPINTETGEIALYREGDGTWHSNSAQGEEWMIFKEDFSLGLDAIEFTINQVSLPFRRAEVIEFSARKHLDITKRTKSFSLDLSMEEVDWMRILGKISANMGSIEISNWDSAFQLDEIENSEHRLKQVAERMTTFTFDVLYDLNRQGLDEKHPVRIGTMHSAEWTRDGEFDYTVQLFDAAKVLQNTECPDIFERNAPIHVLVAQILDSVGFTNYSLDREDYAITSPVLDFFANESGDTVWGALTKICESSMSSIFFDEWGVLQLLTKNEITRYPDEVDYSLYGEKDADDANIVPNISSLQRDGETEANSVTVNWTPRDTKKDRGALSDVHLTDIVWQTDADAITLQTARLVEPMTYGEERFFWIGEEDARQWQWSGKGNLNGETIQWEGKEYQWLDGRTGKTQTEILYSHEDVLKRDNLAKTGMQVWGVNKYTGKIALKRDKKTGEPIGRAADDSKYRIDHYTTMRPGWMPYRYTVGNAGMTPGYWPGEESTSFYQIRDKAHGISSVGINRPTNRNDDWFKTQAMIRSASNSVKLQQWGFKFRFMESTTIGEISLMFNMGTSPGNSEISTTLAGPAAFNQMYQVTFLETQNLVRNATHEIGAWIQSPDPVHRTHDNAIRGSASRMYSREYHKSWEERMKGYQFEFERGKWYDVKIDLTRGRGYAPNHAMHFFIWINGQPIGGFDAAGPPNRHKFLAPTNYWGIGCRAASKVEIANAYSWTEFADPKYDIETYRYDFTNHGYRSTYLEEGILYPAKGKSKPFRDGAGFDGEFFFDDMGSSVHEIREFEVEFDKAPAESVRILNSNENILPLDISYGPNSAKFAVANLAENSQVAHGEEELEDDAKLNHTMLLYGYVLEEGEEQSFEEKNEKAIKDRGEVAVEIDATWINSRSQAEELSKWIIRHFSEPKDRLTVEVFGDASFSVGDKVNIFYKNTEIDPDWVYIVSGVDTSYSSHGGLDVRLSLRRVRNNKVEEWEYNSDILPPPPVEPDVRTFTVGAVSGRNTSTWQKGKVAGTDLLIPFVLENGSVGFLGGDSFSGDMPGSADWRSPVAFRSNRDPQQGLIVFDSAYRTPGNATGNHLAPEIIPNSHVAYDFNPFGVEYTVIPNDGYAFAQTGRQIVSYQSVNRWRKDNGNMSGTPGAWRTNYTALAFSDNGNDFEKWPLFPGNAFWLNNTQNSSPFQMQSWQDGKDGYMYMISVKAGRQSTPLMLQRVPWEMTFWKPFYQGRRKNDSGNWVWGGPDQCTSLFEEKVIGEPSLRRLDDGTWAMAYWTNTVPEMGGGPYAIVTRTAPNPAGPWTEEKVQVTHAEIPNLYGGFIHPYSTSDEWGLTMMISQWTGEHYRVLQVRGSL